MNPNDFIVPKEPTYNLPEGRFRAYLRSFSVRPPKRSKGKDRTLNAIIQFDVTSVPGMENYDCKARKVVPMDLKSGSELRRFLEGLLGSGYFSQRSNQAIDLRSVLEGQACEVVLIHAKHDEECYKHPLVDVLEIFPLTLRMAESPSVPERPVTPDATKGGEPPK